MLPVTAPSRHHPAVRARASSRRPQRFARCNAADGASTSASGLRLFLDSASVAEWERWLRTGIFHGVTTNPSILEKDGVRCDLQVLISLADKALKLGAEEIQLQTWGTTPDKLLSRALELASIDQSRVVVKLPCTFEGIRTAGKLRHYGIRTTVTAVYAAHQAVTARGVGAEYVAPYLGRMSDSYGRDKGFQEVVDMHKIVTGNYQHPAVTRVLVASIRDASDIAALAAQGCDTFTFSPAIAEQLFSVDLTLTAAADFEAAVGRNH